MFLARKSPTLSLIRGLNDLVKVPKPPSRQDILSKFPAKSAAIFREAKLHANLESTPKFDELIRLHPDIWSIRPRLDVIQKNVKWQFYYKKVSYIHRLNRHEMPGGKGPRPWPQKGTGRARHRTRTSPIWIHGGKSHGPQNPRSFFHMINYPTRVNGLIHTLAVKFAQDDVHFVKSLDVPTKDGKWLEELIDERNWGISALIVDVQDVFPENITAAADQVRHINLMPAYGLNVHSMLKHKTLILTLDALNHIENKLLFALNRLDQQECNERNYDPKYSSRPNEI